MMVRLSPDRRSFTIGNGNGGGWSGTYPVEDLANQLRFYRGLRDRKNGAYAKHYEETVRGLEALAEEVARPA